MNGSKRIAWQNLFALAITASSVSTNCGLPSDCIDDDLIAIDHSKRIEPYAKWPADPEVCDAVINDLKALEHNITPSQLRHVLNNHFTRLEKMWRKAHQVYDTIIDELKDLDERISASEIRDVLSKHLVPVVSKLDLYKTWKEADVAYSALIKRLAEDESGKPLVVTNLRKALADYLGNEDDIKNFDDVILELEKRLNKFKPKNDKSTVSRPVDSLVVANKRSPGMRSAIPQTTATLRTAADLRDSIIQGSRKPTGVIERDLSEIALTSGTDRQPANRLTDEISNSSEYPRGQVVPITCTENLAKNIVKVSRSSNASPTSPSQQYSKLGKLVRGVKGPGTTQILVKPQVDRPQLTVKDTGDLTEAVTLHRATPDASNQSNVEAPIKGFDELRHQIINASKWPNATVTKPSKSSIPPPPKPVVGIDKLRDQIINASKRSNATVTKPSKSSNPPPPKPVVGIDKLRDQIIKSSRWPNAIPSKPRPSSDEQLEVDGPFAGDIQLRNEIIKNARLPSATPNTTSPEPIFKEQKVNKGYTREAAKLRREAVLGARTPSGRYGLATPKAQA